MKSNFFTLHSQNNFGVTFYSEDKKNCAIIRFLESDITHVIITNCKNTVVDKTWVLAPEDVDIPLEGRIKLDSTGWNLQNYIIKNTDTGYEIETKDILIKVNSEDFVLNWHDKNCDNYNFLSDRKFAPYNFNTGSDRPCHHKSKKNKQLYYGLGEKTGNLERGNRRFKMKNVDTPMYDATVTDPLYKHIPFYMVLQPDQDNYAYGIFYDNFSETMFDMGVERGAYFGYVFDSWEAEYGDTDYYIISGKTLQNTLKRFVAITGRSAFFPKWSLSYSGSTMSYTEAENSQELMNNFIENCRKHDIICRSFHLSSGYTTIKDKRYVFNWNSKKFPSPKVFTEYFLDAGVRICPNIKPCLLNDHPLYEFCSSNDLFIKSQNYDKAQTASFWGGYGAYLDFTNRDTIDFWKKQVTEQLLKNGLHHTWNDNNEWDGCQNSLARCNGFGIETNLGSLRPIQTLLMVRASFEAQEEFMPGERVFLISRAGLPRLQSYAQTWSGDNHTDWVSLKYSIKIALGMSLSGIYSYGSDVGGFGGPPPTAELLLRWVQNAIFQPRFSIHSWNEASQDNITDDIKSNVNSVTEPWMYPEVTPYIREAIKFRESLIPYFYTLSYQANKFHEPIMRPTFYEYQNDKRCFEECDEFFLGKNIFVATVINEHEKIRKFYLPEGDKWCNIKTGKLYEGGNLFFENVGLEDFVCLAKIGSAIPINSFPITFDTKDKDERTFLIFAPDNGSINGYSFEDDGISYEYKNGNFCEFFVYGTAQDNQVNITFTISGNYKSKFSKIFFKLSLNDNRDLIVNGKKQNFINLL